VSVFPLGLLAFWVSRPQAVQFPLCLRTVGELVLAMTSLPDHAESGHRWTRDEIAFKVRLIVAEHLGLPLDVVQEESTFEELGAD
jgi:hypothetical protein